MDYTLVLIDNPAPHVRRVTLNRPEKRNRAFPAGELARETLRIAQRIANIPSDVLQVNKRTIHRAMDHMGLRQALRAGTELSAVATSTEGFQEFIASIRERGLTEALSIRDAPFQDGRTITAR